MTLGEAIKNLKNKLAKVFYAIGDEIAGGSPFRGEPSRGLIREKNILVERNYALWHGEQKRSKKMLDDFIQEKTMASDDKERIKASANKQLIRERTMGNERVEAEIKKAKEKCAESYRRGYDQAVYDMRGKEK